MPTKKWTRDAIIAAIREYYDLYGRPPAPDDWRVTNGRWPQVSSLYQEFGSWPNAMHAARLLARHERKTTRRTVWSNDQIIAAIQQWAEENGRPPGFGEWSRAQPPDYPSSACVHDHFGSWNAAIAAAGFSTIPRSVNRRAIEKLRPWNPQALPNDHRKEGQDGPHD